MEDFDFMEQLLNPFVIDRLTEVYTKDEEYQRRLKDEDLIYQKLLDELTDEQAERLEQYFVSATATAARKETLTYTRYERFACSVKNLILIS